MGVSEKRKKGGGGGVFFFGGPLRGILVCWGIFRGTPSSGRYSRLLKSLLGYTKP